MRKPFYKSFVLLRLKPASSGYNVKWFQWSTFFQIFEIIIFCFVIDICDLVHDVEGIHVHSLC